VGGDALGRARPGRHAELDFLITIEGIDELISQGFPLVPWRAGRERPKYAHPAPTLNVYGSGIQAAIYDARVHAGDPESPRWGLSGFYASVVRPGTVSEGDTIEILH
jgi:hypothetical protein